jgi:hypothetical protein
MYFYFVRWIIIARHSLIDTDTDSFIKKWFSRQELAINKLMTRILDDMWSQIANN